MIKSPNVRFIVFSRGEPQTAAQKTHGRPENVCRRLQRRQKTIIRNIPCQRRYAEGEIAKCQDHGRRGTQQIAKQKTQAHKICDTLEFT
jgi:hypothetical protein